MNIWQKLSNEISGKRALTILVIVILVHLGLMITYLHNSRIARETVQRDAVIQKIINAIFLVEATPVANRVKAISAMDDPDLHVSLSHKPKWELRFKQISFWGISKALRNNLDSFSVSIRMGKEQWLNLNATIYTHIVADQFVLLGIEVIVLGSLLVFAWSINRFTQPIRKFKLAAEQLGIDLNSKPLEISGGPIVVREAAAAINQMQRRIQDLIRDRTQMLAAISHDLRTPITRMKLRSQLIDDIAMQNNLAGDLDEMEKMINETLAFAREDSTMESTVKVDLVSLITTITHEMQDMKQPVTFHSDLHRASVEGRPLALRRAMTNLINNGIRYADNVIVTVSGRRGRGFLVTIEDDGPGIPADDLERVFAPFYRLESSRSRDTGGVGLGLAVTRDIFQSHGARIMLQNKRPHGLRVVIIFV
ncbi:MAG: two-component sensor histidine kinase [Coxiella sp. (in: Bacteria)]|nr:MAG: two-component sensor histidine kinase [Coxiella sp. (in: g-proteobacteria)]